MTEYFLDLIPEYGLWVITFCIAVACTGIPLPAAIIALTSGGLAAAGDLNIVGVIVCVLLAYLVGDQFAFWLARSFGAPLLQRLRGMRRVAPLVDRGTELLEKRGRMAVFLSHTVLSPLGPYVTYVAGASGMRWSHFTLVASVGAALWTSAYALLGFFAAGQLPTISDVVVGFLVSGFAFGVFLCGLVLLTLRWRQFELEPKQ
ncbi:MAG: DedA family protein [Pseudomonadota bacterium]